MMPQNEPQFQLSFTRCTYVKANFLRVVVPTDNPNTHGNPSDHGQPHHRYVSVCSALCIYVIRVRCRHNTMHDPVQLAACFDKIIVAWTWKMSWEQYHLNVILVLWSAEDIRSVAAVHARRRSTPGSPVCAASAASRALSRPSLFRTPTLPATHLAPPCTDSLDDQFIS
jgi:hypothetical protein